MLPDDAFAILKHDPEVYARECLKIVTDDGERTPLLYRPAQRKVIAAVMAQRRAGKPARVRVLKSRRTGVSTCVQGLEVQTATLVPYTRGLTVAQDNDVAGELFGIAEFMYDNLPGDVDPRLKPGIVSRRAPTTTGSASLHLGEASRTLRARGERGIDSLMKIDTAKEVDAGRGKTITFLHASEAAVWPDPGKVLALFNAVLDKPHTVIIEETTAKGINAFKNRWDRTVKGFGSFIPVFVGWLEDPNCVLGFDDPDQREKFEKEVLGRGEYGQDEWRLLQAGASLEQLHWRRNAIVDKGDGNLDWFKQEYPSVPEEAFLGTGKHVFSMALISRALDRAARFDPENTDRTVPDDGWEPPAGVAIPPLRGRFEAAETVTRPLMSGTAEAPTKAIFVPGESGQNEPLWKVWEPPLSVSRAHMKHEAGEIDDDTLEKHLALCDARQRDEGAYITTVDPSLGEINTAGEGAYMAIQVVDHATGEQVACYRSREDPDVIARKAVLASLYFNSAWLGIEITGGYGLPLIKVAWEQLGYPMLYERQVLDGPVDDSIQKFGWSTDRRTKPLLEAGMAELLRQGTHGIRDMDTALELTTYVRDERGRTGPEAEQYADLLMSYMIAQELRRLIPLVAVPVGVGGPRPNSMTRSFQ
jgi:hypothetical protein